MMTADAYFIARAYHFYAGLHQTLLAADLGDTLAVVVYTTFLDPQGESLARQSGRSVTIYWPDGRYAEGKVDYDDRALMVGGSVTLRWGYVFPASPLPLEISWLFSTARYAA